MARGIQHLPLWRAGHARLGVAATIACLSLLAGAGSATAAAVAPDGPGIQPRIVGGSTTTIEQWPWQVALVERSRDAKAGALKRQFCGGTLVAPTVVITAAHCLIDRGWRPDRSYAVVSGRTQLSGDEGAETRVAAAWVPSDPDGQVLYDDFEGNVWDAAVVVLADPARGVPIAIAGPGEEAAWDAGSPAFATGWGLIANNGRPSDRLRVTQLAIDPDSRCAAPGSYGAEFDTSVMLCASYPGRDTCQGDSGGPLVVAVSSGEYRLVGDTSFGRRCADPQYPGVYGRLAADPMRTALEQGIRQLAGAEIVAGSTTPALPTLGLAAAHAKAAAYADYECDYVGSQCRRAKVLSCVPQTSGFRCRIANLFKSRRYGKSSASKQLLITSENGAARILMVTGFRYADGWP